MRKVIFSILLIGLLLLAGCSPIHTDVLAENLTAALESQDMSALYDLFWDGGGARDKEEFVASQNAVLETAQVENIKVEGMTVIETDSSSYLDFTCVLTLADGVILRTPSRIAIVEIDGGKLAYSESILIEDMETGDKLIRAKVSGKRGEIFTADGEVIAKNGYADSIVLNVPAVTDINSALSGISDIIELSDKEWDKAVKAYESAVEHGYADVIVKSVHSGSITDKEETLLLNIEGVYVDRDSLTEERLYPNGAAYAHVSGYTRTATEDEYEELEDRGLASDTRMGATGVELAYNDELLGRDGWRLMLVNKDGAAKCTVAEYAAESGTDLWLSIDSELQEASYYLCASYMTEEMTGVVITLDPTTGEVLSYVSWPSFDTNLFNFPISDDVYKSISSEENGSALFSKGTQGLYPPGSLWKPFAIVPSLESGQVNMGTVFPYEEEIIRNAWTPHETWPWEPIRRDTATTSPLDLVAAIRNSDNIYFGWAALELGAEPFMEYMRTLGVEEAIPFDLYTAEGNLINEDTVMDRKLLSDMSFGHGQILVTPLQIASMYTAFKNGGDILAPSLLKERAEEDETGAYIRTAADDPGLFKEDIMKDSTVDALLPAFREVVRAGTASSLDTYGITIYAKTGTALKGLNKTETSSWVCAWLDGEDEERLVLVLVDAPREENTASVKLKIARELLLWGLELPEKPVSPAE